MPIDLNAPAFGKGAQKVQPVDAVIAPKEAEEVKVVVEEEVKPVVTPVVEDSEEESQVPYRRFKKFHDAAKDAEERAEYWRQEALRRQETPVVAATNDMPNEWVKLYGDTQESKDAWNVQKQMFAKLAEETRQEALEAVRGERYAEEQRTEENVEVLDEQFDDLQDTLGRTLTDAEQSALLDIVDEFTPKDRRGNYAGDILPFEKAWEIYEMKSQAGKAPKIAERNNVAALTGQPGAGAPNDKAEADKNWNPLDWNSYTRRI